MPPELNRSRAWMWGFLPLFLIGTVQFFRGGWMGWSCLSQGRSGMLPTVCIDPYWVNQWLKNYAGGFTKRGLLGDFLRHVFHGSIDLLGLNLVGWLLLLAVYGLLYWLLLYLVCRSWGMALLLSVLLVLSPLGKSLAETALDPLQVCLMLLSLILLAPPLSSWRDAMIVVVYLVSSLVYEGSLLLLLPAVVLLMRPLWTRLLPVGLGVLLLVIFQRQDSPELGVLVSQSLQAVNSWTGQVLMYQDGGGLAASVSFAFNVKQEFSRYLSDAPRETISRIARSLGAVLAYLLVLLTAIGHGAQSEGRRELFVGWLWFAPFALPFILITHDWFRYGVVILLMALVVAAARRTQGASFNPVAWAPKRSELLALVPLVVMVLAGPATRDVRKFLPHDYFYASMGMLSLAVGIFCLSIWLECSDRPFIGSR